jgi:putative lipoic acid-binding regulatory protein
MILENESMQPDIQFPCEWSYKVIGLDVNNILTAIEESVLGLSYDVTPSNLSKTGKYVSLNLKLEVPNEEVRNLIYEKLNQSPDIKYII